METYEMPETVGYVPCTRCGINLHGKNIHCDASIYYDDETPLYCSEECYGDIKHYKRQTAKALFYLIIYLLFGISIIILIVRWLLKID